MLRAQGYEYTLPELDYSPLFITRLVLEDEGKPVQALFGRLTSEAYFLEDPESSTPQTRMRRFLFLHHAACDIARSAGIDSVHVWLPPQIKEKFGPQLERLGWNEYVWPTYAKHL